MSEIIDMHVHYYTDIYLQAVENASSTTVSRREHDGRFVCKWRSGVALTVPQPHPGVQQRLEMMDELGVAKQVLSIPSPSVYFLPPGEAERLAMDVNESFAEICRDHDGRFESLAAVPLQDTERALATVEHAIDQFGMAGVMLLTNIDGVPLDDPRFEPFWAEADARKLLVYVHPTVPDANHLDDFALAIGVGFFGDTNLAIARLAFSGVFARYPNIRWVFSHLGGTLPIMLPRLDNYYRQFPECQENAPEAPTSYIRRLMFDTATTHRPAIRCAIDTLGLDRLLFGSDFPHVPGGVAPFLDALDETGATGGDWENLVSGRARRLLSGEYS